MHFSVLVIGDSVTEALNPYNVDMENSEDEFNPDGRWDWWVVGGRWSDMMKLVPTPRWPACIVQGERSWCNENEPHRMGFCDGARKGDIDFAGMREDRRAKAEADFGRFECLVKAKSMKAGNIACELGIQEDRKSATGYESKESYVHNFSYFPFHAIINHGEWSECPVDGPDDEWQEQLEEILAQTPDTTLCTLVDCHL